MSLDSFLRDKPLYYNEIDYTRMPRIYEKIKACFPSTNIIHVIGTNGKGTTGRFLATALFNMGYKTGHYTSPHILEFNERVWVNGENASYESLENSHKKLQEILTQEDINTMSYFEYTTLLSMLRFEGCEYIVLEAGLGGEHDATAVFPKVLTLVTPIDYDHESFLGNNIEDIATTKLNAVQNNAIIASQKHEDIYSVVQKIEKKNNVLIERLKKFIDDEDTKRIENISKSLSLASYLEENLKLSIACLKFLNITYEPKDFNNSVLFGRLTRFKENVIIDVGHNPLAASSIAHALAGNKYILVYNTYKDKEYKKILQILEPIILNVKIININDERIVAKKQLQSVLTDLEIKYDDFKTINQNKNYLVFGSFSVVEEFLKVYSE